MTQLLVSKTRGWPFYGWAAFDTLSASLFDAFDYSGVAIKKTDDGYSLSVELPGFKKEEVSVELDGNYVTIKAKSKNKSYFESFNLGRGLDAEKVNAKLEDGVLTVSAPTSSNSAVRKIEIKSCF